MKKYVLIFILAFPLSATFQTCEEEVEKLFLRVDKTETLCEEAIDGFFKATISFQNASRDFNIASTKFEQATKGSFALIQSFTAATGIGASLLTLHKLYQYYQTISIEDYEDIDPDMSIFQKIVHHIKTKKFRTEASMVASGLTFVFSGYLLFDSFLNFEDSAFWNWLGP